MPSLASPHRPSANSTRWMRTGIRGVCVLLVGASSALGAGAGSRGGEPTSQSSQPRASSLSAGTASPIPAASGTEPASGADASSPAVASAGDSIAAKSCLALHEQAQEERFQGELLAARATLARCAEAECPTIVRTDCVTWLGETVRLIPTVRFEINPVGPEPSAFALFLDEQRVVFRDNEAVALDPGSYHLRVEANGYRTRHELLVVRQGEKSRTVAIQLELESAATADDPRPLDLASAGVQNAGPVAAQSELWASFMPALSYTFAGLAVAGAGSALYWGRTAAAEMQEAYDSCSPICSAAVSERIYRKQLLSDVSTGVSVLSVAIAATLLLLSPAVGTEVAEQVPLRLEVGRKSLGLRHWRKF